MNLAPEAARSAESSRSLAAVEEASPLHLAKGAAGNFCRGWQPANLLSMCCVSASFFWRSECGGRVRLRLPSLSFFGAPPSLDSAVCTVQR